MTGKVEEDSSNKRDKGTRHSFSCPSHGGI